MEINFLPVWANIIVMIAIILLCVTTWSRKFEKLSDKVSGKTAYYTFAVLAVAALGVFFFMLKPVEANGWLVTIILVILALAFFVGVLGGMDSDDLIGHVMLVSGIAIGCIIFVVLLFGSAEYAAIWLQSIAIFAIIGKLLYSPKKEKK